MRTLQSCTYITENRLTASSSSFNDPNCDKNKDFFQIDWCNVINLESIRARIDTTPMSDDKENNNGDAQPTTATVETKMCNPVPVNSVNSPAISPSSTCSSPDHRWPVVNDGSKGAGASSTSLSAEASRPAYLSHLVDSRGSSPASTSMSPDYPRGEYTEQQSRYDCSSKIIKTRRRRPDPCDLTNDSPRSCRYSSPEYTKSARRMSSTSPGGEFSNSKDTMQSRETHRRGRPRADQLASLIIEGSTSPSNIKCSICFRVFPREKSRQAHERIHRGDKPYTCDYPGCSRAFAQTGQLNTHQRLHTGEKPFLCSEPGCEVRFTHSNRHCPEHPTSMLIRTPLSALRPITENVSPEVRDWLEKYNRAKNEKTPKSNKRSKSRKSLEIKTEQENLYGCKQQISSDNEDFDSQDESIVSKSRRTMKSRKNLEMGACDMSRNCYTDDYNYNEQSHNESQDESHDENLSSSLQSEEEEIQFTSSCNQSFDRCKGVKESNVTMKSNNKELVNGNYKSNFYLGIQPYQDEDFQVLPISPIQVFKDNIREIPLNTSLPFEDEDVEPISSSLQTFPATPLRRPIPNERYNELDATLESEMEEPTSSVHQQLLVTPIRHFQNNKNESQDETSPLSQNQEPDTTTYQLPSTPVSSRPSQCLPLKKRWGFMNTQYETQNEGQNQPLIQPIKWNSNQFSNSDGKWNYQGNTNISVIEEPIRYIQVNNEDRPSVLRRVGKINYDEPSEVVVTDIQPLEQVSKKEVVDNKFIVAEGEKHAIVALLNLGN